ncbi:MAG TPA: hypothetical protein VF582_09160 [Allosphingosinicella sp.]|jgi:hypothetical protein
MIYWGAALLLMALAGAPAQEVAPKPVQYAQLTVRQQIIVRVPARPHGAEALASPLEWKEGKGIKCIPASSVAGAALPRRGSVDLVLRDRRRVRAKLENSCPALDYYNGFYISPNAEGMICADKQSIRSRMGGECQIDAFKTLKPVRSK